MQQFYYSFHLIIILATSVYSQSQISIHELEQNAYGKNQIQNITSKSERKDIVPLKRDTQKELGKAIFGYYPDWEYLDNAHLNFDYSLLTHIAAFDFQVSNTGQISDPAGWPWTGVINDAHNNGVKIIMVVVNFDADDIHEIITNSFSRWTFMIGVKNKILQYNLNGVNIDFEGLHTADRGNLINKFMQELSDSVHSLNSELEVSFAAPAVNWNNHWDLNGLANSCDYLFIMGYDFYGSWSTSTGPTAPLNSNSSYNIRNTIEVQYSTVTLLNPEKLILGVPYYGPHWTAQSSSEGAATINYIQAERYRQAQPQSEIYGIKWSTTFSNSWYSYTEDSYIHQVWFDTDASLSLKYDLAIAKNLKGIGMWALGYDGARTELWDLIRNKFSTPVSVKISEEISTEFLLSQNYPNPFNPVTTISYSIPDIETRYALSLQLKVLDVLGREVATLVNEQKNPGNYKVMFDGSEFGSGTYFYKLQYGSFIETKKMILLK